MRKAIAATMSRSKREIPHYYLTETADLHDSLLRRRVKARAKGHASDKPQLP
jgi:pyruvate/2-oxoglutarate dehydrogenase complex dihydrolipoamide acyltransferase (E2) component